MPNDFEGALPEVIESAVGLLADEMKPRMIVLFGSAARGEMTEGSDIDLLVVLDGFDSRRVEMARAAKLLVRLPVPADVLVYTETEVEEWGGVVNHIINEALLDGRVVYEAA